MTIRAIQDISTVDYPDVIAATIFTQGCNLRCPFCHNAELVPAIGDSSIPYDQVLTQIKENKLIKGVCITGGEPTLLPELPQLIADLKKMGLLVKLDTNGTNFKEVKACPLPNYVAIDFKQPIGYNSEEFIGRKIKLQEMQNFYDLLEYLNKHKVPFELRTTVVPRLHTLLTLRCMASQIKAFRSIYNFQWFFQPFIAGRCLDPKYNERPDTSIELLEKFAQEMDAIVRSS